MLEKIFTIFGDGPLPEEKVAAIVAVMEALFAYVFSFMGIEVEEAPEV